MAYQNRDGFWEGGSNAWWRGLKDALKAANERLRFATTDAEQHEAQTRLEELRRQEADARRNDHRWLH